MRVGLKKIAELIGEEFDWSALRIVLVRMLLFFVPSNTAGRLRARMLRLAGFDIENGVIVLGIPAFVGRGNKCCRLRIGAGTFVNAGCFFDLSGSILIGEQVSVGPEVMLITGAHATGEATRRAGAVTPKPIAIGDGAWLGARSIVLPGITVGAGAIVAAGAVVTKDVAPDTVVGGVPAVVIRNLA